MAGYEVSAKIDGAERFADRLDEVYDDVVERTQDELEAAGETLVKAARGFAPVDTGQYRDSLRMRVNKRTATVFTRSEYGGVVEFGQTYERSNPGGSGTHKVENWGSNLASPPRVIYRALDKNVRGIADSFFDAMLEEFRADGWLD